MGPRSDNRGYQSVLRVPGSSLAASMGPRSDNRGYQSQAGRRKACPKASMGPRSDNRGYQKSGGTSLPTPMRLQWVHGRMTVVIVNVEVIKGENWWLQWVHGRITVVISEIRRGELLGKCSFNGSTVG